MAQARKLITDFTGGEVSDRLLARIDTAIYNRTLRLLQNFIVHASGGLDFAPGTVFICEAKTNTGTVRLLPFEKSSSEKYVLELTDAASRFYKNKVQLQSGGSPLEITTPWLAANLFGLRSVQSSDALYIANKNYQLHKLRNISDLIWFLTNADLDYSLAVAHATSPYLTMYSYFNDVFNKRSDPATLPANTGKAVAFSPDSKYLAVGFDTTAPYLYLYKRSGDSYVKLANLADPPTGGVQRCTFSYDGVYLAVAHTTSPYITIYKRDGNTFNKLTNPGSLPTGNATGVAFSPDAVYLAVSHYTTPFITIYKRTNDTFNKLSNPTVLPGSNGRSCAFSPCGTYLVVGHESASAPAFWIFYKRDGDTFVQIANPALTPGGAVLDLAFSSDGAYLAAAGGGGGSGVSVYRRSGDVFTRIATALGAGSNMDGCAFSVDSLYLAVCCDVSPWIKIYKRSGDSFTALSNPGSLPTGIAYGARFSLEGWAGITWGPHYPSALAFHEQRLALGRDQTVRASRSGWAQDFSLSASDASYGYEYTFASDCLEEIIWLKTKAHNIIIGTTLGEWLMTGGDAPITGNNVFTDRVSGHGSYSLPAVLANESLLFLQTGGQRLREFMYSQERGGYISPDLTQLADHIGEAGFVDFAWQRSPRSLLWTFSPAGELETLTLDRNSNIIAWGRHPRDGLIKSIAVVSGDETDPEGIVYLCVQRVIAGVTKQYIEYLKPINRPADEKDYFFVDCGKTFDYSATTDTMEGATKATPVVVTATAHPFVNDEFVRITGVVGMTQLNGNTYMVKNKAADTFELYLTDGMTPLNGTAFGTWISGGLCEKVVKDLSGLDHLKLKTVAVYADGVALGQEVVSSGGTITIDEYAAKIHVGLPYTGKIWTQRLGGFSPVRIPEATLLLYKSRGGKIGPDADNLKDIRYTSDTLLTGPQEVRIGGRFSREGSIMIVQDQPLPMTVLGIVGEMAVGEE